MAIYGIKRSGLFAGLSMAGLLSLSVGNIDARANAPLEAPGVAKTGLGAEAGCGADKKDDKDASCGADKKGDKAATCGADKKGDKAATCGADKKTGEKKGDKAATCGADKKGGDKKGDKDATCGEKTCG